MSTKKYPQNRYYLIYKVKSKMKCRICNRSKTIFVPYHATENIQLQQLRDKYQYSIQTEIE